MEKNITHCAVIYTQNVDAHQAIQSVLDNQKHFQQLHIIDPTRAEDDRIPEGFRIPVHYHGTLEPQHFPDNAIVTIIPPHACVKSLVNAGTTDDIPTREIPRFGKPPRRNIASSITVHSSRVR